MAAGSPPCDRAGRLFLQALGSGPHGVLAAYRVVHMFSAQFPWDRMLEDLCMAAPAPDGPTTRLVLKPRLFQLPIQLQRNFFSLLPSVSHLLPAPCLQLLAETVRAEPHPSDEWLLRLTRQLSSHPETCVQRAPATDRLQPLLRGVRQTAAQQSTLGPYRPPWDSPPTACRGQCESGAPPEAAIGPTVSISPQSHHSEDELEAVAPPPEMEAVAPPPETEDAPASISSIIAHLKQSMHLETDPETLDQEYVSQLRHLCEVCNPLQLRTVLSSVGVAQMSPKSLYHLCSHLDLISPALSYGHAEALADLLFLGQVLLLSAPASRTLTAALTVFCRKYARPACHVLIGSLLATAGTGSVHADFLCRMVSECLESHELHLCFEPIFRSPCSEASVRVLHMLVEKKETLNQSEFDFLLGHLGHAAEDFSKSMTFSKFLLVLLTSKKNLVQLSHIELMTNVINSNQTFMKKSLQNALHRVQESLK
ncbi:Fanconi anemia group E protein [Bufo gargarizans]|uniref:Fanconi anemia group E protein n=1 Tax=Bufo gargarizans TaxID=30331 RepID=UPI001CF30C4E|nr:Fanconi anemia group E protein [Bufo gargarizans]